MPKLRSHFVRFIPRGVLPRAKRIGRRLDQLRGQRHAGKRPGVVVMLHVGRCGSTVLANLLSQNPGVYWDGKLPRKAHQLYGARVRDLDHAAWVQQQFAISGARFYGFEFKILEDQYPAVFGTSTAEFLQTCRRIGVTHYILLVRRNTLRHVVSHYASKNRGSWHAQAGDKVQKKTFSLDTDAITTGRAPGRPLASYLEEVDAAHAQVRDLLAGERLLEIEYERDIDAAGAQTAYERVCAFLGIAPGSAQIRNRKMNPYPLTDVLENFEAVEAALADTPHAWMTRDTPSD